TPSRKRSPARQNGPASHRDPYNKTEKGISSRREGIHARNEPRSGDSRRGPFPSDQEASSDDGLEITGERSLGRKRRIFTLRGNTPPADIEIRKRGGDPRKKVYSPGPPGETDEQRVIRRRKESNKRSYLRKRRDIEATKRELRLLKSRVGG
ncbi:hypothetical protein MMC09_004714, partial [Bachmanniomyces sp. S44760]|nr:hypothetical protein [Bachmanniomyces sp. S44760]